MQALEASEAAPLRVVNPRTKEAFVLLRVDEYDRLKEQVYDDSPWTREELQSLNWKVAGEYLSIGELALADHAPASLEAKLIKGLESGEPTPMTAADWSELRNRIRLSEPGRRDA